MISKQMAIAISAFVTIVAASFLFYKGNAPTKQERTFAIIKPEAVQDGHAPEILKIIKEHGFTILSQRETTLSKDQAEQFYSAHKDKPFFTDLITYITSGPVILLVLEKNDAIKAWRDLMGATNPEKASPGTIRKLFGKDIQHNAVHGSDSQESAQREIGQFFSGL